MTAASSIVAIGFVLPERSRALINIPVVCCLRLWEANLLGGVALGIKSGEVLGWKR